MATLKDTNINGSLSLLSSDKAYYHDVAYELESFSTRQYVLENIKQSISNALTWKFLDACNNGTANKTLPSGYTWNSYKELLLTVGVWLSASDTSGTSRILASTLIPVSSKTTSIYGSDANGRYQVRYDTTSYWGGFNILSQNTYQIVSPNLGCYVALWAR